MIPLKAGDIGEVSIHWKNADGKWIPRTNRHKQGQFRARVAVMPWNATKASDRRDIRRTGRSPQEAREAALKAASALAEPVRLNTIEARTPFPEVAAGWMEHLKTTGKAEGTIELYSGTVKRYLLDEGAPFPLLASLPIEDANDPGTLRDLLVAVDIAYGPGAARTLKTSLSSLFGYAKMRRAIANNAVKDVERWKVQPTQRTKEAPKHARNHARALTEAERSEILRYAEEWANDPMALRPGRAVREAVVDLLYVLALTGARFDEGLSLRREDVNLSKRTLRIRGTKTETSDRVLPIQDELLTRLRARKLATQGEWVFPAPGAPERGTRWDVTNARRVLQSVMNSAGFDWATPHTFRTTLATLLIDAGAPIRKVADWMGHADVNTTWRFYAGRNREVDADMASLIGTIGTASRKVVEAPFGRVTGIDNGTPEGVPMQNT